MSLYQQFDNSCNKWKQLMETSAKEVPVLSHPGFSTVAIHEGQEAELVHGSVNIPIHYTSTYKQKEPNVCTSKFDYSRGGNPTVDALNQAYAGLERAKFALTFASGCAATNAILMTLEKGTHVITIDDLYGGTNRMLNKVFSKFGLETTMIEMTLENIEKSIKDNTKLIWLETPTNPLLKLADIEAVCSFAKSRGIKTVVDNTFASSYLQSPLLLGADVSLQSCTKFLSGHSDVIAGMIATNDEEIYKKVYFNLMSLGGCISPMDAFLLTRSLKTLKIRMREHCKSASAIIAYLKGNPQVSKIYYPGFGSDEQAQIAKKQMRHPGSMVSFEITGDLDTSKKFIKSLKVFTLAESLGGAESLIELPALMTHASVPAEQRARLGITDTLIRVSIGLEEVEDLLDDLERAFSTL